MGKLPPTPKGEEGDLPKILPPWRLLPRHCSRRGRAGCLQPKRLLPLQRKMRVQYFFPSCDVKERRRRQTFAAKISGGSYERRRAQEIQPTNPTLPFFPLTTNGHLFFIGRALNTRLNPCSTASGEFAKAAAVWAVLAQWRLCFHGLRKGIATYT